MNKHERGSMFEAVFILIALIVVLVFFILPQHGVVGPEKSFYSLGDPLTDAERNAGSQPLITGNSGYTGSISISQGNAAYAIEPSEEYIMLENRSEQPINITGWKLTNAKGTKTYTQSGNTVHLTSDEETIPQAVGFINPSGLNILQNVILQPGDEAVITSGKVGIQSPYAITNFKENECSGYLGALPQYNFSPSLNSSCVLPSQEPGVSNLDSACRTFIQSIGMCQTPTYGGLDNSTHFTCDNCVNGRPAPSDQCFAFIKAHYSYSACIANHQNDAKFYSNTWRIFLGRQWEMWDKDDETISLFDQFGKLITSKSY